MQSNAFLADNDRRNLLDKGQAEESLRQTIPIKRPETSNDENLHQASNDSLPQNLKSINHGDAEHSRNGSLPMTSAGQKVDATN